MSAVEGKARAPELDIRDRDPSQERRLLEAAAETLFAFSDQVEVAEPDVLYIEIGRSAAALETMGLADEMAIASRMRDILTAFGHDTTIAIADDPDTARTLARARSHQRPVPKKRARKKEAALDKARPSRRKRRSSPKPELQIVIAEPGRSAEALSSLSIDELLWTDAELDPNGWLEVRTHSVHASLRVLGVSTVGQLAVFPVDQVKSRFQDAGALLIDRALGQLQRPLRPYTPPEKIVESYDLDDPIESLEPVLFLLKRLLDRIEARLYARGRAAEVVKLSFVTGPMRRKERIRVRLTRPTRSSRTMLRLCREKVTGALGGAIHRLSLEVSPVADLGAQLDLFTAHERRVEKVEELIDRLQASLGEQAVFAASLHDSHRPEAAWKAQPFEADRAFEEPTVRRGEKRAPKDVSAMRRSLPRDSFSLPAAEDALSVVEGMLTGGDDRVAAVTAAADPTTWPKTVKRHAEDEPLPVLPPRPLELLRTPEPVRFSRQYLHWRGERLQIADISGREQLSAEWWMSAPLEREYLVVSLSDGRRVWVFMDPDRRAWVHGVFD